MEIPHIPPQLTEAVAKHHPTAIALSDDLAAHPELPDQEFRSSKKIVELLEQGGYQVEYPYLGYETGFRAVLDNGEGPSAAILVEYDALPGLGHACGHNVHGSMSVLAALALAELREQFKGKIYVFGTPAEEEDGAKVGMADKGAFDGMSAAMMIHSYSGGYATADMDVLSLCCYLVEFKGQSAHAVAGPWKGHNALAAARKFLDLIDARRECFTPDIHVNGVITDGGTYPNILPERAEVRLEFRTDSQVKLKQTDEVVKKCANGAAMALDCTVSFTTAFDGFADMVRVPVLEDEVMALMDELGVAHRAVEAPNGSSDVGNVSYRCPTIQPLLPICNTFHALHTVEFRDETTQPAAHEAIASGAKIIAATILRTMTDEDFRQRVQASYLESRTAKTTPEL
ncbi:MAG: M20 family metallopeptidase [Lawsonibacter sp.]|nr:M20 family metallopeptidase [Lawsonibacter sp.]